MNQAMSWEERREGTEDAAAGIAALKRADGSHRGQGARQAPPGPRPRGPAPFPTPLGCPAVTVDGPR